MTQKIFNGDARIHKYEIAVASGAMSRFGDLYDACRGIGASHEWALDRVLQAWREYAGDQKALRDLNVFARRLAAADFGPVPDFLRLPEPRISANPKQRSRFRNGDEEARAQERRATSGDPAAVLRHAIGLWRTGRLSELDPALEAVTALLPDNKAQDFLSGWAFARTDEPERPSHAPALARIRLFRAALAAGVRYPEPAFLALLTGPERELACVVACNKGQNSIRMQRRVEAFGFTRWPHALLVVTSGVREALTGRDEVPSNQHEYKGEAGLARARAEAEVIEEPWAEIVRAVTPHVYGRNGFAEHVLFLTRTGYATSTRHYSDVSDDNRVVVHWDYDFREGFLEGVDPLETERVGPAIASQQAYDIGFISAVHELELKVQDLLGSFNSGWGEHHPGEVTPGSLVDRALQTWILAARQARVEGHGQGRLVAEFSHCGAYDMPPATCLVVVPPGASPPAVVIGISGNLTKTGPRSRNVTPANFWPELAPWSNYPDNKKLMERLATWARTEAKDRVVVEDGRVAQVWADWSRAIRQRTDEMVLAIRQRERDYEAAHAGASQRRAYAQDERGHWRASGEFQSWLPMR